MADADYGARVRAAQAYAGLEAEPFAEALGFSKRTLDRLVKNERELTIPEARQIAEVCKIPVSFLVEGWNVARSIQDRLSDIERRLEELATRDGELTAHERELLSRFDEMIQRLGRDIGRGQPRSRGAKGLPSAADAHAQ
jgi:transcriptional regulator with XRE-family HTH domain